MKHKAVGRPALTSGLVESGYLETKYELCFDNQQRPVMQGLRSESHRKENALKLRGKRATLQNTRTQHCSLQNELPIERLQNNHWLQTTDIPRTASRPTRLASFLFEEDTIKCLALNAHVTINKHAHKS